MDKTIEALKRLHEEMRENEKQKDDVVDEIAPALMGLARGGAGVGRAVAKGAGAAAKGVGKLFKSVY